MTTDGARIDPFYVIETSDFVVIIATTTEGELVLVRQYRHGYGELTLEMPAGRVDEDEDPIAAGVRELAEETGYGGGHARLLRSYSPETLRYANRLHVVLVEGVKLVGAPQDDPRERIEVVRWPMDLAMDLLNEPEFANAAFAGALATALAVMNR